MEDFVVMAKKDKKKKKGGKKDKKQKKANKGKKRYGKLLKAFGKYDKSRKAFNKQFVKFIEELDKAGIEDGDSTVIDDSVRHPDAFSNTDEAIPAIDKEELVAELEGLEKDEEEAKEEAESEPEEKPEPKKKAAPKKKKKAEPKEDEDDGEEGEV